MKLIDNFVEKFHNYSLSTPEKCFVLEEGNEIYKLMDKKWKN